jgi:hypothetical protein
MYEPCTNVYENTETLQVGQVVRAASVSESKGQKNGRQIEYFHLKK